MGSADLRRQAREHLRDRMKGMKGSGMDELRGWNKVRGVTKERMRVSICVLVCVRAVVRSGCDQREDEGEHVRACVRTCGGEKWV